MGNRSLLIGKPTVEIDQDRYEELIRSELKYKQYMQAADGGLTSIIETDMYVREVNESEEE